MMTMQVPRIFVALLLVCATGCPNRRNVPCVEDSNCDLSYGGVCLAGPTPSSWCAYPDPQCPGGYRYSDFDVGDGVSGECVAPPTPDAMPDAAIDAPPGPRCNKTASFQAPTLFPKVNSALGIFAFSIAADERVALITGTDNGSDYTLRHASRPSLADDFSVPSSDSVVANMLAPAGTEGFASIASDGLTAYFTRANPTTFTTTMHVATRSAVSNAFTAGSPVTVDGVVLSEALRPTIAASGMTLYWIDETDLKLKSAARGSNASEFFQRRSESTMVIGGGAYAISADELTLYYGGGDIASTSRSAKNQPFSPGVDVPAINSSQLDQAAFITQDDCLLFIASQRAGGLGGYNIWVARRGN